MSEESMNMTGIVNFICKNLTDVELAALFIVVSTDQDPRGRVFDYNAISSLFTEDGGTKMHSATKEALEKVVSVRLA